MANGKQPRPLAKRPGTRAERFKSWDRQHKETVLKAAGLTLDEYRALSRPEQNAVIGKGQASIQRRSAQLDDPARFVAPLTTRTARQQALNSANLVYGGQEQLAGQYGQSVDPWFDDYVRRTQAAQGQQRQQAQGIIDQSVTQAQQQGQTVLPQAGVDPNSEAAQNDILAAASRKALADGFTKVLQGNQAATDTAYVQQGNAAEAARIGEHTTANQQRQQIAKEKGQYRSDALIQLRKMAHTERLENAAFDLDVTKAEAGANADANEVNQYGVKASTWAAWGRERRKKWIAEFKRDTAAPAAPRAPGEPKYGIDADDWATMSPAERKAAKDTWEAGDGAGDGKDQFGNTVKDRRRHQTQWERAKSLAGTFADKGDDWRDVYEYILSKSETLDASIARAAAQWATGSRIGPTTRRRATRLGVKLPKNKQKKPGTSSGGGGGPHGTGKP